MGKYLLLVRSRRCINPIVVQGSMTVEEERSLRKRVERIFSSSSAEHIVNIFKAGLATAPFCGGIASLIADYIPSGKQKRLEEFTEQVAKDLNEFKQRVDETKILTDEFAFIFERCYRGVAENYQKEKLEAFRAIFVNTLIGTDLSDGEKEYFLGLVNNLSVLHIRILRFMFDPKSYLEAQGIPLDKIRGGFSEFFPIAIPGIEPHVIEAAFSDLYQYGLIGTDKKIFRTVTAGKGLELLGDRVSELGKRFITFCTVPQSGV